MRRAYNWVAGRKWLLAVVVLGLTIVWSWRVDQQQDRRERREDVQEQIDLTVRDAREECINANASRALIRDIGVQLNVAAVAASTESLIFIVSSSSDSPPDQSIIDAYRTNSTEQATTRATAIVAQLEDRDCAAEQEAARSEAERRLRP